jgi:hypothetical protein
MPLFQASNSTYIRETGAEKIKSRQAVKAERTMVARNLNVLVHYSGFQVI